MKWGLLLLALLGAAPLHAQEAVSPTPTWMYVVPAGGHLADYLSSVHFSLTTSCHEANWAKHPDGRFDARKGVVTMAGFTAAEWAVLKLSERVGNRVMRTVLRTGAVGLGAGAYGAAAFNEFYPLLCSRRPR